MARRRAETLRAQRDSGAAKGGADNLAASGPSRHSPWQFRHTPRPPASRHASRHFAM